MASNIYVESLISSAKRLKISTPQLCSRRALHMNTELSKRATLSRTTITPPRPASQLATTRTKPQETPLQNVRLPKAVQAVFLQPLRRQSKYGIPVCDLQIRSYSARNLEAFADFCMRAAYYLGLPARGPVPLPRITERWTVPRSNFVHKKSQENFERITVRRLVQIQDGHSETVALWLAYIQQHRVYGVGLKANVFEHGALDDYKTAEATGDVLQQAVDKAFPHLGKGKKAGELQNASSVEPFKAQWGAYGAMGGLQTKSTGRERFRRHKFKSQVPRTAAESQPSSSS